MSPVRVTKMRWNWVRKNMLLLLTFSGVVFGIMLGVGLKYVNPSRTLVLLLSYPGELFIRMLKLMILPLVIASLVSGSASLNAKMNGKIVGRTIGYFLVTSFLNAILGVLLAIAMQPGNKMTKEVLSYAMEGRGGPAKADTDILDGFLDLGRNIIPDNLFEATFKQAYTEYELDDRFNVSEVDARAKMIPMVKSRSGTNTLGIIVFCLVFGTMLGSMGKKGASVVNFFQVIDAIILKIVTNIMWISPVGIASVIMHKIVIVDNLYTVMTSLAMFIICVIIGVFIYQLIIQNLIYFLLTRRNPFVFYFNLLEAWATAFATASTAATLPVTFKCMKEKCGVDVRISHFVLPIGATVNMDGTALFVSIATIFIAQVNEISLSIGEYATIVVTSTAASVASASVPSAALVLIMIVLTSVNVPTHDVTLLFTIDWLLDRFRTTNNCFGDCYAAAVVEKWSKEELEAMDAETKSESNVDLEKVAELTPLVAPHLHVDGISRNCSMINAVCLDQSVIEQNQKIVVNIENEVKSSAKA